MPSNNLVPALPLRLNYLHWLSDIFEYFKLENVVGIDIGMSINTHIYCK